MEFICAAKLRALHPHSENNEGLKVVYEQNHFMHPWGNNLMYSTI